MFNVFGPWVKLVKVNLAQVIKCKTALTKLNMNYFMFSSKIFIRQNFLTQIKVPISRA